MFTLDEFRRYAHPYGVHFTNTRANELDGIENAGSVTINNRLVNIPMLKNPEEYKEWALLTIDWAVGKEPLEYRIFEIQEHMMSEGFAIYKAPGTVVWPCAGHVEFWEPTTHGVVCKSQLKDGKKGLPRRFSLVDVELSHSILSCPGDLYTNPKNKEYHHLGILSDGKGYWGQDVYYTPYFSTHILLRFGNDWIWCLLNAIQQNVPAFIADEFNILRLEFDL